MGIKKITAALASLLICTAVYAGPHTYIEGGLDIGSSFVDISMNEEIRFGVGSETTKLILGLKNYTTVATALTYEDENGDETGAKGYDLNNPAAYLGINVGWWYMFYGAELNHYKWIEYGKSGFYIPLGSPVLCTGVEIPLYDNSKNVLNLNLNADWHYTFYGDGIGWKESAALWIVPNFYAGLRYRFNFKSSQKSYSSKPEKGEVYFTID